MPVPVNRGQIQAELAQVEAALEPADPKTAAALIAQTVEIFGVPKNWDRIADFYLEALEDVPPDLAALAMKRVRQSCKFFPKPAEMRALIADELSARKTVQCRLQHAFWRIGKVVG